MTELTFIQILEVMPGLQQLAQINMTLKQSYDIGRVLRKIGAKFDEYNKLRDAKVRELGVEQADGTYQPLEGERDNIKEQLLELGETSIELDIEPIPFTTLEAIEANWKQANPDTEASLFTPGILASIDHIITL